MIQQPQQVQMIPIQKVKMLPVQQMAQIPQIQTVPVITNVSNWISAEVAP